MLHLEDRVHYISLGYKWKTLRTHLDMDTYLNLIIVIFLIHLFIYLLVYIYKKIFIKKYLNSKLGLFFKYPWRIDYPYNNYFYDFLISWPYYHRNFFKKKKKKIYIFYKYFLKLFHDIDKDIYHLKYKNILNIVLKNKKKK